jgi:hypothetical protein
MESTDVVKLSRPEAYPDHPPSVDATNSYLLAFFHQGLCL